MMEESFTSVQPDKPEAIVRPQDFDPSLWADDPYLRLYQGIKPAFTRMKSVSDWMGRAAQRLRVLDSAPRHDTVLSDDVLDVVWQYQYSISSEVDRAESCLKQSLQQLEDAAENIRGQLRGEEKVLCEDRLARHLSEARQLLAIFRRVGSERQLPVQPYLIRQFVVGEYVRELADVVAMVTDVRKSIKDLDLADQLTTSLAEQQAALFRLKARMSKLRDNPSQKMNISLADCGRQACLIRDAIEALKVAARTECYRRGMRFFNRCGPIQ